MADPPRRPDDEPEVADAGWLLGDPPASKPAPAASPSTPIDPGEGYAVEGLDHVEGGPVVPPIPEPPPRAARPKSKTKPRAEDESGRPQQPVESSVDEVWTRGAEWGPNLAALALASLASAALIGFVLMQGWLTLAFLFLLIAGAGLLVLSYPIAITLERPVRITPEQAVRDYFAALSHHVPHYRRMWLLLSNAGKTSPRFASLEGFRRYWEGRLDALKGGRAGKYTPLKFQVEDFKAEKSAGLTAISARYTVTVFIRGQHAEGPVATYRVENGLARGPDKMWYLNDGTLTEGAAK